MNEDFDKIESIDYTSFEEKFFEEVRNGKSCDIGCKSSDDFPHAS